MAKKRITTASCKAKARELQKWVCQKISDLLEIKWGKDELIASREMGSSGVDVRLIGEALKRFPYAIEAKRQEKVNIWEAIQQAKDNQLPNTNWLVFIRRSNEEPIVILDANVFFDIMKHNPVTKPF